MKQLLLMIAATALLFCYEIPTANAQSKRQVVDTATYDVVIKNDGTQYTGKIISNDAREVLIETKSLGRIYIPKHEIREIKKVKGSELNIGGEFVPEEVFATRYFLTTNGLPIKKGESYVDWTLLGPEIHFGVSDNFGVGVMTSWLGVPLIGTLKYSIPLNNKTNLGVGALIGTGSWAAPDYFMGLPFTTLTFGDRRSNLNLSAGYGFVGIEGDVEGRALISLGAMTQIAKKVTFVFDSVIVPSTSESSGFAMLMPGFRWQSGPDRAFQFGFGAISVDNELIPVPIPLVQWFRTLN
jgi:hypothetical protein